MELTEEIKAKLEEEFHHKYITGDHVEEHFNKYTENGVGSKEVLEFPDTPLHRQLYHELYNFEFYGFACYISRNYTASWCGYVKTEKNHPLWEHGKFSDDEDYIENEITVHGGITYIHKKEFTIGFDCAHCFDEEPFRRTLSPSKTYRTRDYVIRELKDICRQLYDMLPQWSPKTHSMFPKKMRGYYFSLYKIFYLRKQSPDLSKLYEKDLWIKIVANAY